MTEPTRETNELVRIRVGGGKPFVGATVAAVAAVVEELDFTPADVERVCSVVKSLCRDVIECHFDDPQEADFTMILREDRAALTVRIEDEGIPYPLDHFSLDDGSLIGRRLAHGGADSVRCESRGVGGNAVELTVRRSPHHQTHLKQQQESEQEPTAMVDADAPITVRELTPDDAPGLARCVYRCYGYTYANDFIYYPDRVLALIDRNLLRSFVGLNPDGEVVGHSGIIRDHPESWVAETGMAVVDPRYRHHHLLESINSQRQQAIREMGLLGTYADAVAVHPITQKANVRIGACETGILLAEIPEFTTFRGLAERPHQRSSVVMFYHPVGEAPLRQVFLPPRHKALLESIYRRLGLRRTFHDMSPRDTADPGMSAGSSVHVELNERRGLARIEVESAAEDVVTSVAHRSREVRRQRFDVIHLDLSLGDRMAMAAVDNFAELGFFYGAVIPELREGEGDVLRLQYLNNVNLDPDALVLYSDEAKRILRAILADRALAGHDGGA